MPRDYLNVADVVGMHAVLMKRYGGASGLRDPGALEAALFRPQTGYYDDIVAEAADERGLSRRIWPLRVRFRMMGCRLHLTRRGP